MSWLILLVGFISGILGGMGLGGGTILIPALTIFLSFEQTIAQGFNLISFIPMAVVAIIIYFKNNYIHTENLGWLIIPGIMFSVLSAIISNNIPKNILRIIFGGFLIVIGLWQMVSLIKISKNKK